jgi:hypothetical protein
MLTFDSAGAGAGGPLKSRSAPLLRSTKSRFMRLRRGGQPLARIGRGKIAMRHSYRLQGIKSL